MYSRRRSTNRNLSSITKSHPRIISHHVTVNPLRSITSHVTPRQRHRHGSHHHRPPVPRPRTTSTRRNRNRVTRPSLPLRRTQNMSSTLNRLYKIQAGIPRSTSRPRRAPRRRSPRRNRLRRTQPNASLKKTVSRRISRRASRRRSPRGSRMRRHVTSQSEKIRPETAANML